MSLKKTLFSVVAVKKQNYHFNDRFVSSGCKNGLKKLLYFCLIKQLLNNFFVRVIDPRKSFKRFFASKKFSDFLGFFHRLFSLSQVALLSSTLMTFLSI